MNDLKNKAMYSNAFMIVSFLFIGILFVLFMFIIDVTFGGSSIFIEGMNMLADEKTPFNTILRFGKISLAGSVGLIGISIFALYAIGFLMYCISMLIVAIPSISLMRLYYKDYARYATDNILDDDKSKDFKFDERIDFLYLFLRTKNEMISQELKFLFNQIMFARSNLGGLLVAFMLKFAYQSFATLSVGFSISFIVSIAIYIYTIAFFDRMLYSSYLINIDKQG